MDDEAPLDFDKRRRDLGLSYSALADMALIPRMTLTRKLAKPGTFTLDEAAAINAAFAEYARAAA